MLQKRLWIIFAICVGITALDVVGAERSHQATAAGVIDPSCTSSLPCIEYDNNGTGPGIRGISVSGNGLAGATKNASTSATNGRAGLIGNDTGTGTFNSGVHGLSVNGTGVSGLSTNGPGLSGSSTNNDGVDGLTTNPTLTTGFSRSGVFGLDKSSDFGHANSCVLGFSTNGVGVAALSSNWIGVEAVGGGFDFGIGEDFPALSIAGNGNDLIDACPSGTGNFCGSHSFVFQVDSAGSVIANSLAVGIKSSPSGSVNVSGQYLKSGSCVAGCPPATTASAGRAVMTYSHMVSQPTIEDFGEAQLVNGQASVRLDPKFANVIEQTVDYLVFITPEGDANVLYVAQKSRTGFGVRESHGGRSTITFSYRIVAKPFGSHEARLPMVELPRLNSRLLKHARRLHL